MSKIAIVTDSNAGFLPAEAEKEGIFVLPMPFMIGEETYFENIDLTQDAFYKKLESDEKIITSQPSPESVMKLWERVLGSYDEIIHIPMSSGLSGSCQSAMMLAEEFDGKVHVVNNQRISVTQMQSVLDAQQLAQDGHSASEIKKILEQDKYNSSIYIMLDTLTYLKKGGRITPAAAALGTVLRLKPVLQIQGEKLDAFAKARTSAQGKSIMIKAVKNDLENRFQITSPNEASIYIAHSNNLEGAKIFRSEVEEAFPGFQVKNISPLSLSVSCHIGPGSLALACTKELH